MKKHDLLKLINIQLQVELCSISLTGNMRKFDVGSGKGMCMTLERVIGDPV